MPQWLKPGVVVREMDTDTFADNTIVPILIAEVDTVNHRAATIFDTPAVAYAALDCGHSVAIRLTDVNPDQVTEITKKYEDIAVKNSFAHAMKIYFRHVPMAQQEFHFARTSKSSSPRCPTVTSVQEAELLLRTGCGVAIELNGKTQQEIDTIITRMRELMTRMPIPEVPPMTQKTEDFWNPVLVGEFQVAGQPVNDVIRIVDAHTEASKALKLGTSIALRMEGLARRCWGSIIEDFKVAAARHPHMTFRTYFRNVDDGQTQLVSTTTKPKRSRGHNPFCAILDDFAFVKQEDAAAAFPIKTDSADVYSTPAPTPAKPSLLDIDGHDIRLIGLTFRDTLRACQEDGEDKANTLLRIKAVIAPLVPTGYAVTVATFQTRSYHRSPGEFVGLKDHVLTPMWVLGMDLTRDDDPDILSFGEEIKPWW